MYKCVNLKWNCKESRRVIFFSSIKKPLSVNDPLIVILGIGEYDRLPNWTGVTKDYDNYINTFVNSWKYKVFYQLDDNSNVYSNEITEIERNYKLKWDLDEICEFVETVRKYVVKNKHNGLLFAISSHGDNGKVIYDSADAECDLDEIFSMFSPQASGILETYQETPQESKHLLAIPKIFLVDGRRRAIKAKITTSTTPSAMTTIDNTNQEENDSKNDDKFSCHARQQQQAQGQEQSKDEIKDEKKDVDEHSERLESISLQEQKQKSPRRRCDISTANTNTNFNSNAYANGETYTNKSNPRTGTSRRDTQELQTDENKEKMAFKGERNFSLESESNLFRTIAKLEAQQLAAQMANFCKLYTNIDLDGFAVADSAHRGGLLSRSVCRCFKDRRFILPHQWSDIMPKIREYANRNATSVGLFNWTQLVEVEGTLERPIFFDSKYINMMNVYPSTNVEHTHLKSFSSPNITSQISSSIDLHDAEILANMDEFDNEMKTEKLTTPNLSSTKRIAVRDNT